MLARARYVRVAVERGIDGWQRGDGDDTLTYRLPEGSVVEVGRRVLVPLGRGDTVTGGYVVEVGGREMLGELAPARVKPIRAIEPTRLPASLIELATWMGQYYVCPLGMVLATMMPAAVKQGTGRRTRSLIRLASPGLMIDPMALKPVVRAAFLKLETIEASIWPMDELGLKLALGLKNLGPVNGLVQAGVLERFDEEHVRASEHAMPVEALALDQPAHTLTLTPEQRAVVDGIAPTLGTFRPYLLLGVTGSGKTEVYLRLLSEALARGQSAIMLVPEISLTPQTASRLMRSLGGPGVVAVMHSGLTASQRHAEWARAASGRARVVIGARSAIFAPLEGVGLIIVDEEHATDYKQDQLPRYQGRDVAIKRAQIEGCPIVLGSATPSMESWANATGSGAKYALWRLTKRVAVGAGVEPRMPTVRIVDLAEERRKLAQGDGGSRLHLPTLGPTLAAALRSTLEAQGQAIVLLNRRGFASHLCCASAKCGWVMLCDDCDATHVWHRSLAGGQAAPAGGFVRCHHCQAQKMLPKQCPECQSKIIHLGEGTQRVEEDLARMFPQMPEGAIVRADGDTMTSARTWFSTLSKFQAGQIRVLLGTQMLAKGHDFPNVRLVGIINADTSLMLPDFRSSERTFQLVSQVAGRAGRGEHAGLVIVQTLNPKAPAIVLASRHDYEAFASEELAIRARSNFPPCCRMARVVVRDRDRSKARGLAEALAASLREAARESQRSKTGGSQLSAELAIRVMGPMDCPIARIATYFRQAIEIYAPSAAGLSRVLQAMRRAGLMRSDGVTAIDVDPVAVM
jgi:primosomal protein N' (replication factor Y) (superfamily II helicase)